MFFYNAQQTAELLPFDSLVRALRLAVTQYSSGEITSPERMVVSLNDGGVMLSMPATASDIAIHKLVNVQPSNARRNLPTIHGQVAAFDSVTGVPLFTLDGPTVTGRRTAAVSMLGIECLTSTPVRAILIIGTGTQAVHHVQAIQNLYPSTEIWVRSRSEKHALDFCTHHSTAQQTLRPCPTDVIPDVVDVVITVTTSKQPIYNEVPKRGRLIIAVGAFTPNLVEIGAKTINDSQLFVDDPAGAKHEAGDFIQAGVDWQRVQPLTKALDGLQVDSQPIVFKTVGCAAWDLAACRTAQNTLSLNGLVSSDKPE